MKDITGQRFGMLTVLEYAKTVNGSACWRCRCDCGITKVVSGHHLREGNTKSCGCLIGCPGGPPRHGRTRTREYRSWLRIKHACSSKKNDRYIYYGGRGILMHPQWANSFEAFLEDMGPCPEGMWLLRKDKEGHFEPKNCHWGKPEHKMRNTRTVQLRAERKMGIEELAEGLRRALKASKGVTSERESCTRL